MPSNSVAAFVSYAHESRNRDRLISELAARLRGDGVHCDLDQYEESPDTGWPTWMEKLVWEEGRFILVVPSAKYLARWSLTEQAGVGLGAKWEAKHIKQKLYEDEGFNTHIIPVVFDDAEIDYLPAALRDVTHYNVSRPEEYDKLLRRLLDQPSSRAPQVGAPPRLIPELEPRVAEAMYILQKAAATLPAQVLAVAVGMDATTLRGALAADGIAHAVSWGVDDLVLTHYKERPVHPQPDRTGETIGRALDALLAYLERHSTAAATPEQFENVLAFCKTPDVDQAKVATVFDLLQKPLKRLGDKRLVLETASVSLEAARRPNRHEQDARQEALVLICGTSWVLQRVGRLNDADADAQLSLELGQNLQWDRNTAFCLKCIGRLRRLRAEAAAEPEERRRLLEESEESLRSAIDLFGRLHLKESQEEQGESWSLLGRTFLKAGRRDEAEGAVLKADELLVDDTTKAYLDLQILRGDLNAGRDDRVAESFYTRAISLGDAGDAQRSEIIARAFFARGRLRAKMKRPQPKADFKQAAETWQRLEDPALATAEWEIVKLDGVNGLDLQRLDREPEAVRVRAVRNMQERLKGVKGHARKPAKVEPGFLEQLISESKRQLAIEKVSWVERHRGERS